jgi:O-antigen ligase
MLITLLAVGAVMFVAQRLLSAPSDALIAGLVMVGLLIGNRGFAQLHVPNVPLLPAEAALGFGLLVLMWTSARMQQLPFRLNGVGFALLCWVVVCAIRLPMDLRRFGFIAVRDFAMVYYALFFFLAQHWAEDVNARAWLRRCLLVGLALAPLAFEAFKIWPESIASHTLVRGVPLIFIKGDSAAALMAGGAAWCGCLAISRKQTRYAVLGLLLLTSVLLSNSRAAMVALMVIGLWFVATRGWKLLRAVAIYLACAVLVALAAAAFSRQPWHETEIYRGYERVASIVDFTGSHAYRSEVLQDKADNNDFRLTWWRIVARQTWDEDRWFGAGFGSELAAEFTRIYYPDADESFTARSPHNFVLTVFARSGLVGFITLLVVIAGMARETWRAAQRGAHDAFGLWLFGWGVLVSACFGVVLEGPMGAVVFWTVLGLANSAEAVATENAEASTENVEAAALPDPATSPN